MTVGRRRPIGWGRHLVSVAVIAAIVGFSGPWSVPIDAQARTQAAAAATEAVPKDLRPLLAPPRSEMRLIVTRYTLDRATLHTNYTEGMRQGPRPPQASAAAPPTPAPVSTARLARLKRFDLDWQAALDGLDVSRLSSAARADLASLRRTITENLAQLEADAKAIERVSRVVPFAPDVVRLVEARIRIEDVDPQQAAGLLARLNARLAAVRADVEAGLSAERRPGSIPVDPARATAAAGAIATLRTGLTDWFTFYNGYDPLFTWWMGVPFRKLDAGLQEYATFLTTKVAAATVVVPALSDSPPTAVEPTPAPAFASVPDLQELLALSSDELSGIVLRFQGTPTGGRGAGAAGPGGPASQAGAPQPVRDKAFYQAWLSALRTLDFAKLSRNAQVDYLYIRTLAEQQLARAGVTLPANPPRKADASGIQGPARGRQALIFDLQDELVPYTPDELITFAESELAWCEREMKKASAALGFGDDWKRAIEHVKGMHPPPGRQKAVVRDLMLDAVAFLRQRDLITVPAVAAESLHMIMMTPERQLVNPFFTGGFQISVSYPTDTMDYDTRLQSMRGNNTPFSHATAFHEMIPGHNLVFYMTSRYGAYRARLGGNTPFFAEGWPLYWELLMYDNGFHATPEQKIGALVWRMHRCARIIFSLKFHMGEWSPQECIDFLADRVGFERDNAAGEVRRSFQGSYPPLYQAAYLLGGLQLRSLRRDLVDGGAMTEKAFHDEVMRQGTMPIAMLRLAMGRQPLTRATRVDWRFLEQAASR